MTVMGLSMMVMGLRMMVRIGTRLLTVTLSVVEG